MSERLLQSKVKTLTRELETLKQGYNTPAVKRLSERSKSDPGGRTGNSVARKSRRKVPGGVYSKARTPSPASTRFPRFDPTAYIEQKKKGQLRISRMR